MERSSYRDTDLEMIPEILWDEVILPEILAHKGNNLNLRLKPKWLIRSLFIYLFYYYENKIKNNYMINSKRIDRHKICSICIKCIKFIKFYTIPFYKKVIFWFKGNSFTNDELLINEEIAINVAYKILGSYIKYNFDIFRHSIVIPEPFHKKNEDGTVEFYNSVSDKNIRNKNEYNSDQYIKNYIADLYFSSNSEINIFTHSNVFFLWEKYSCRKAQCDNLEEAYKQLYKEHCKSISDKDLDDIVHQIKFKESPEMEKIFKQVFSNEIADNAAPQSN